MAESAVPPGFADALRFPLLEAILGRRSRRFPLGAEIPDGVFAFTSRHPPQGLSEEEKFLLLTAMGGNTGWHHMIHRHALYAPRLSNYAAAAGGRTFPSAAGFETSELFFTDDHGVYLLATRDAPALGERDAAGRLDPMALVEAHKGRVRKIQDGRLDLPGAPPHMEGHNTWVVNRPGTLLVIPVADLAQHLIANLCYYLQNRSVLTDDVHLQPIPGLEEFRRLYDPEASQPLSLIEQFTLAEITAEVASSCYAGALTLQAMGLGGWMFNGLNPFSVLGCGAADGVRGLGFRYDLREGWAAPNPTGLPGVFECFCPPHYPNMRAAVDAFCARKFGPGGPFHPDTPGPWRDSRRVRQAAEPHSEEFRECVARQAQYVLDRFGKFPGTVPSALCFMYLQACHLDLEFYDAFYKPGAYLETHARHMERWRHDERPRQAPPDEG